MFRANEALIVYLIVCTLVNLLLGMAIWSTGVNTLNTAVEITKACGGQTNRLRYIAYQDGYNPHDVTETLDYKVFVVSR